MRTEERKRTFDFGKIAYWNKTRKSNPVEVKICLRRLDNGEYEFTASGLIWNHIRSEAYSGGQNLDTIRKYVHGNPIFNEIFDLWSKFHLNGLCGGTRKQKAALVEESNRRNAEHKAKGEKEEKPLTYADRYEDACEYLKSIGLYIDKLGDGEVLNYETEKVSKDHYPYGCGWITRVLDDKTLKRINSLIDKGEVYKESEV